jgi:P27 family predicted phage terminase small subunit
MPGPPRTPTVLALIKGDPGHRAKTRAKREPKPPPTSRTPPKKLRTDPEALATWRAEAPTQIALGTLTKGSRLAFTLCCATISDYWQARTVVETDGLTIVAKQGEIPHPAVGIMRAARRDALLFLREFGMTPAALSRVTGEAMDDDGDELAAFRKAHPPRRA